jgi:glyceraldehyde-3-phosphate dehydrogenase (NAD(P))
MAQNRIVHVIGTGNVGEPLIGLLADFREAFGIEEVTFTKRSPLAYERAKVESLVRRGAQLCVDRDVREEFIRLGHSPTYDAQEALERARVVIDCTPAASRNKSQYLNMKGPAGFIAAGGVELGFGKLYINEINDSSLVPGEDRFIQVASGNAHSLAYVARLFAFDGDVSRLRSARFVCMRRTSDFSQERNYVPSPRVLPHDVEVFGTRQAREAVYVFKTLGQNLDLRSSAVQVPTQLMHTIWFTLDMERPLSSEQAIERVTESRIVARTDKQSSTLVFAFARDHGYRGRILSRLIVPTLGLSGRDSQLDGFCFEPQSNELISTVAATIWLLYPNQVRQRLEALAPYVFDEV